MTSPKFNVSKFLNKRLLKNRYVLATVVFLVWMLFFDSNNFIDQMAAESRLNAQQRQKNFYEKEIEEMRKQKELLLQDEKALEKLAREKYYMKKDNEDLFIILEK